MIGSTNVSAILLIMLLILSSCATSTNQQNTPSDLEVLSSFENTISQVVEQSMPAIVSLSLTKEQKKDNKTVKTSGGGSGFIFHKDGYILTNQHVVDGAISIRVSMADDTTHVAQLVGADPNTDVAVIKIDGDEDFPFLKIADTSKIRVGQFAIAIGDPIGYRYTVTAGIVGGIDRCFHPKSKLFQYHRNYIQTDAWINPGSSGGPLLNIKGEVIGINSLNPGEGSTLAVNIGLAEKICKNLIAHGRIIRGYIDAGVQSVSNGVKITRVKPNTHVSRCGLKRNDIIVELDGKQITNLDDFEHGFMDCQIGKQCPIKVLRDKQEVTLNVLIDEMPLEMVGRSANTDSACWRELGLAVRKLEDGIHQRYAYITEEDRGLLVEKVKKDSLVSKSDISRGALITAINGKEIVDENSIDAILKNKQDLTELILDIKSVRGNEKVTVKLGKS